MKTITVRACVNVPRVPNYLRIDDDHKLSIADVPDDELRNIGEAWTEALIERAAEIRRTSEGEER